MKFEFPELTGSYNVGTTKRHIIDEGRIEPHNPSQKRELMINLWYPTIEDSPSVYCKQMLNESKSGLKTMGYREDDIKSIEQIYCHATQDATPVYNQFPIVLFSHGFLGSIPEMYTSFCENLASHGYVVVAPAHTYYAKKTTFPNGTVIETSPKKYANMRKAPPSQNDIDLWIGDIASVIDYLTHIEYDRNDIFYGSLDLEHIGMFGHSFGGCVAFQACVKDDRFKAGMSFDGLQFDDSVNASDATKPFYFVMSQDSLETIKKPIAEVTKEHGLSLEVIKNWHKQVHRLNNEFSKNKEIKTDIIQNLKHGGFTDFLILKEAPVYKNNTHIFDWHKVTGNVNGFKMIAELNAKIKAFFNEHLK